MIRVVFLGTNGWYDTNTGNTICIFIDTDNCNIILDAGNGIAKLDRYADLTKPTYLFLSHFHLDHIIGFHIISKFNFTSGLWICGQEGISSILGRIVDMPYTLAVKNFQYKTQFIELPAQKDILPFSVESLPLVHASYTLGFRFEIDGKIITFCADTGYCENAVKLAKNADFLMAECAFKSGQESVEWPHLNPEKAARIAREANARRLALVHFDAEVYKTIEDRYVSQGVARQIFPDTVVTNDDMIVEL